MTYREQFEKETGEKEPDGLDGLYSWVKYEQGYSRWLESRLKEAYWAGYRTGWHKMKDGKLFNAIDDCEAYLKP